MTKIKLCGLTRRCDIDAANELRPEYIGFVFAKKSKRYILPEAAKELKLLLDKNVKAVGVFVNESIETVSELLAKGIIDLAQLHGSEDEEYIKKLKSISHKPVIKAFGISDKADIYKAFNSCADYILLDSGAGGTGKSFEWEMAMELSRPYFLAGGLSAYNVQEAVLKLSPYAVDVSSGIETDGVKDINKMREFVRIVRGEKQI